MLGFCKSGHIYHIMGYIGSKNSTNKLTFEVVFCTCLQDNFCSNFIFMPFEKFKSVIQHNNYNCFENSPKSASVVLNSLVN